MATPAESSGTIPVARPAFVHVCFVAADRATGATEDYARALWAAYDGLGMTAPLPAVATSTGFPPAGLRAEGAPSARMLAAKYRPVAGTAYQAFLVSYHDTIAVIGSLAPNRDRDRLGTWGELARERNAASPAGEPPQGVLGEAFVFLACTLGPRSPAPEAIGEAVVAELARAVEGRGAGRVVLETADSVRLWELDGEGGRVFGLIAPEEREDELYDWVWWRSGHAPEQLPPFVRYILHAAKLRYEANVFEHEGLNLRTREEEIDRAIEAILGLHRRMDSQQPISSHVLEQAQRRLTATRMQTSRLLRQTTRLVELRQTVVIAQRNIERLAESSREGGTSALFADDVSLAQRTVEQIGHQLAYSEAVLRRAAEVHQLSDLLLRREEERHAKVRNDLALIQTSLLGALLAALGAIETFGGHPHVRAGLRAPLVTLVLALVFSLPLLFVRWYERLRLIDHVAGAMFGGATVWLVVNYASLRIHGATPPIGVELVEILAGAALVLALTRWLGRRRLADSALLTPQEVHEP